MELVVGQLSLQKLKSDKIGQELQFLIREEKRKRKRKRKVHINRVRISYFV